jgi:hypothetical protein
MQVIQDFSLISADAVEGWLRCDTLAFRVSTVQAIHRQLQRRDGRSAAATAQDNICALPLTLHITVTLNPRASCAEEAASKLCREAGATDS